MELLLANRRRNRSLYLLIDNPTIVNSSRSYTTTVISEIFDYEKDADGFLYMVYASQESFGRHVTDIIIITYKCSLTLG